MGDLSVTRIAGSNPLAPTMPTLKRSWRHSRQSLSESACQLRDLSSEPVRISITRTRAAEGPLPRLPRQLLAQVYRGEFVG